VGGREGRRTGTAEGCCSAQKTASCRKGFGVNPAAAMNNAWLVPGKTHPTPPSQAEGITLPACLYFAWIATLTIGLQTC
jgi:hypothetical protein